MQSRLCGRAGLEARLACKVLHDGIDLLLRYSVDRVGGENAVLLVKDLLSRGGW